jgi:haloalkane dehalogenase
MNFPAWLDRSEYPFVPRRVPTADGGMSCVDEGAGEIVVLAHGTPTWSFEWRHVIRALRGTHRVIAPDHLGFGFSDRPEGAGYRPEDHARRFAECLAAVLPAGAAVTLVVHDFGGPIALDWALRNPGRVRRVVLVNTWLWSFADDAAMRRKASLAGGALGRWLYRQLNASVRLIMPAAYGDRRKLTKAIHAHYLAVFSDADSRERVLFALAKALLGSGGFYDGLWARRVELARMSPVILWGMKDGAFPPAALARWREAFPGAPVTMFAEAGHWPHEEAPEEFVAALRSVLAG